MVAALLWAGRGGAYAQASQVGVSMTGGFPHLVNVAVDLRPVGTMSYGLSGGGITVPIGSSIKAGISNFEGRVRWHPWSGSLFLGLIAGTQSLNGTATQTFVVSNTSVPTTLSLTVKTAYLTPHLGWLWIWGSGFTAGFETGVQLSFVPSTTLDISLSDPTLSTYLSAVQQTAPYQDLQSKIDTIGDTIGKHPLPYALIRLGWMF